jgi:hypothetical protein
MTALLGAAKAQAPTDMSLAGAYATAYLFYVAPDIPLKDPTNLPWWQQMNGIITGISIVKTFVDVSLASGSGGAALALWTKVSPMVEFAINLLWQVPVFVPIIPTEDHTPDGSDIIGFLGNTSFDVGGMLTPETNDFWQPDPRVQEVFVGAQASCTLLYGATCLMQLLMTAPSTAIRAGRGEARLRRVG